MEMCERLGALLFVLLLSSLPASASEKAQIWLRNFRAWTLPEAVGILNESPWAQRQTFTQVIGGIGSGVRGEKEIYTTFYVRLLSALPIRQAYARIQQIQNNYDRMGIEQKQRLDGLMAPGLEMDVSSWVVVAVGFRSNDNAQELQLKKFFESQTVETLKNTAFLSTAGFPQVQPAAYYPPREESVGAKLVFPREVGGIPVASPKEGQLTFELEIAGAEPRLRIVFSVPKMIIEKELVF